MRLVFVAQRFDEADPVLGIVPDLVRALAARCEQVTVIANDVVPVARLADNVVVRSLGKELGRGRLRRTLAYGRETRSVCARRPDAFLVHMSPIYLDLAAPFLKMHRVPSMLWFAHPAVSPTLKVADRLADVVLTSLPGAYPLPGPKVRVIGQAIDLEMFAPAAPVDANGPLRLLALGRTSPSKGFDTLVRSVGHLVEARREVRLRIVGPSTTDAERRYRADLEALVSTLGLERVVKLDEGMPRSEVRTVIRDSDLVVNATIRGSGDKAVFEAVAAGRPVVASNPSLSSLLASVPIRLTFSEGDDRDLASVLDSFAASDAPTRSALSATLRQRVVEGHSLDHWADEVVAAAALLRSPVTA